MVVDGTRMPRRRCDVAIRDGAIAKLGRVGADEADRVLDAEGLVVAPGFVDLHTHYDAQVFWDPYCTLSGWHGVTSVVIGNCGFGFAPVRPEDRERAMLSMTRVEAIPYRAMKAGLPWDWITFPEFLDRLDRQPKSVNLRPFVPGGTSNMIFDSAAVEFMGQDAASKGPTGGIWALKLLEDGIDANWRQEGYNGILSARTVYTLDPALLNGDLAPGQTNVFAVSSAQLPALHNRIAVGTVSFRMDGPYGTNNLFSWDSGYDRFRENPAATRVKPVLQIDYRLDRQAGDVNGDGVVNDTDARIVAEAVLGLRVLTTVQILLADADRNGSLDSRDAAAIRAKAAGVIGF